MTYVPVCNTCRTRKSIGTYAVNGTKRNICGTCKGFKRGGVFIPHLVSPDETNSDEKKDETWT